MIMKKYLEAINPRIYIALSGLLLGLTVIFAEIGLFAFFAMIPLALMILKKTKNGEYSTKSAYIDGFIFYMSFDIVVFHWFTYFYPLDFAELSKLEAIFVIALAWLGVSALQSVFSAFVFVSISKFAKNEIFKKYPMLLAPYAAALWNVNEWTQTFTWAGVPWGRISISQTEMPIMMQNASLFGSYFLTFVIVLINFLVAMAIFCEDRRKKASKIAALVLCIHVLCGSILYFVPNENKEKSIKIASIQGNIESQSAWDVSDSEMFDIYEAQTRKAVDEGVELVIWPEGALLVDIDFYIKPKSSDKIIRISEAVSNLSVSVNATIVLGTFVYSDDGEDLFNSMSVFYPDGSHVIGAYSKMKPVPFGEYLPMRNIITTILPVLAEINLLDYEVTPGKEHSLFSATKDEDAIKVGTLICFDAIYEALAKNSAREGAEIFVIPSNDSWFYDSRAMNMHHSQNILRAVEQGKYTVNCGNTGITSFVNGKGDVISIMPIYQEGYLIDTVYASSARTLYSYIGNFFVYVCAIVALSPFAVAFIYKKKKQVD